MKQRSVLEHLLMGTYEALLRRKRTNRPMWVGRPMTIAMAIHRGQLAELLRDDTKLRRSMRRSSPELANASLPLTAETLVETAETAPDPAFVIASALISTDDDLVAAAVPLASTTFDVSPTEIELPADADADPAPEPPAPEPDPADDSVSAGTATTTDQAHAARIIELEALLEQARLEAHQAQAAHGRIRSLEADNHELRAKIPTKGARRRQKIMLKEAERALERRDKEQREFEELGHERDELVRQKRVLEEELAETIDNRRRAEIRAQKLQDQLADSPGRAAHLRRSLLADIDALEGEFDDENFGKAVTRNRKQADQLRELITLIDRCFPSEQSEPATTRPTSEVRSVMQRNVALTPIGGGEEIGGSAMLYEAGDTRILVDAGLHPDGRGPADIDKVTALDHLDAVIVTHAHNDHAGYIPRLLDRFQSAKVYTSRPTAQLLPTMWHDSANVMRRTHEEADEPGPAPLYGDSEVEYAESRIEERDEQRQFRIRDIEVTLFPAGHILGAVGVVLRAGDHKVVVSGDVSGPNEHYLSVRPLQLPEGLVAGADLLVLESTYCHGDHSTRSAQTATLISQVRSTVEGRGRVLIPAFGLGRSQEVAMIIAEQLPEVDVLVDGLASKVSTLYETIAERQGYMCSIFQGRVRPVENRYREIQSFKSGVIIASSGMMTGGPSVEWAKHILPERSDALLLCGYQDEEAPGRRLMGLAENQHNRYFSLPDMEQGEVRVEVNAVVRKVNLSAHADRSGLTSIVDCIRPRRTMLVHGERRHQQVYRTELDRMTHHTVPVRRWEQA